MCMRLHLSCICDSARSSYKVPREKVSWCIAHSKRQEKNEKENINKNKNIKLNMEKRAVKYNT